MTKKIPAGLFAIAIAIAALPLLSPDLLAYKMRQFKEVEKVSSLIYRERSGEAWKTHTRLVGQTFNAPEKFTIEYFNLGRNQKYKTETYNGHLSVYESGWIFPGKYRITIKAEGFDDYVIKSLELKKGYDCIMDITFGKKVYESVAR